MQTLFLFLHSATHIDHNADGAIKRRNWNKAYFYVVLCSFYICMPLRISAFIAHFVPFYVLLSLAQLLIFSSTIQNMSLGSNYNFREIRPKSIFSSRKFCCLFYWSNHFKQQLEN